MVVADRIRAVDTFELPQEKALDLRDRANPQGAEDFIPEIGEHDRADFGVVEKGYISRPTR